MLSETNGEWKLIAESAVYPGRMYSFGRNQQGKLMWVGMRMRAGERVIDAHNIPGLGAKFKIHIHLKR